MNRLLEGLNTTLTTHCASPVLKSVNPGSTSPAAMSTDATTGVRDLSGRRNRERVRAPQPVENVLCAGVWVLTCPCGWALSPPCTWTQELPLTLLCPVAMSAQRGQSGTGRRLLCPMGHMPSDPFAPSVPLPSAPPAGHGSSSRAPSTSRRSTANTLTITGRQLGFIHTANVNE